MTILTLTLDETSQARFDILREEHYPPALNRIAAHLTLFHQLPASAEVRGVLAVEAARLQAFRLRVDRLGSLGRGAAYFVESPELRALHRRLSTAFSSHLTAQDRQGFRPHVVVQNKADKEQARATLAQLSAAFQPWHVTAEGLGWWDYLNGPWSPREEFRFAEPVAAAAP